MPGCSSSCRLGRATEYAFTNHPINAQQPLEWGLVNRLAPAAQIYQKALEWALEIARGPVGVMGLAKRTFNKAIFAGLEGALDYETHLSPVYPASPRSVRSRTGLRGIRCGEVAMRGEEFSAGCPLSSYRFLSQEHPLSILTIVLRNVGGECWPPSRA